MAGAARPILEPSIALSVETGPSAGAITAAVETAREWDKVDRFICKVHHF